MEISAYMSMLHSQGFNPATAMSRPSIATKDMLKQLNGMSTSFERAVKGFGNHSISHQTLNWSNAPGNFGQQNSLPGPARLSPVQSHHGVRSGARSLGRVDEQQMIQAALNFHKSIMQVTSAAATVDATSTGAKRSTQNIDTLIRGQ